MYLGNTRYGDRRHLIKFLPTYEKTDPISEILYNDPRAYRSLRSLCGVNANRLVINYQTFQAIEYADHWYDSVCERCIASKEK